jgi:alpha,alpha-trehalase
MHADTLAAAFRAVADRWGSLTFDGARLKLPVPGRYVAAGGFFEWLFYWDSYFIIVGLLAQGERALATEVVDALLHEVEVLGFVPNFNAPETLCESRSQPPLLTAMIRAVAPGRGPAWLERAAALAEAEYSGFWCSSPHSTELGLSRYADDGGICPTVPDTPHFRAIAESGWDNTPRFGAAADEVVPVDLNSLLYRYERDLATFARALGRSADAERWRARAHARRGKIDDLLWDQRSGHYRDLDLRTGAPLTGVPRCLSMYVPLWAGAASPRQGAALRTLLALFEHDYGLASCEPGWEDGTEHNHPTGWAYSHWFAAQGLRRYGYRADSDRIARKWLRLVAAEFERSGRFLERYDVVDPGRATPGRYETQDGFGWTNGVYAALYAQLSRT